MNDAEGFGIELLPIDVAADRDERGVDIWRVCDRVRDESVIGVKNEIEGLNMSGHGAVTGFESLDWRWWRCRGSIRCRSGISCGRCGVCAGGELRDFFFDFEFLVFFVHGGISVAAGANLSVFSMKLSADRREILRSSGGGAFRANGVETVV